MVYCRLVSEDRQRQIPGSYGVRFGEGGQGRSWGNAVVGLRNPVAPPLRVEHDPSGNGEVWSDFPITNAQLLEVEQEMQQWKLISP